MDLAPLDTTRPGTARYIATMVTNRPSLTIKPAPPSASTLDTGTEFPALDTKLGPAMDLATECTTESGMVMDLVTPEPEKLGKAIATAGTAPSDTTTEDTAMDLVGPEAVKLGTARTDTAMALARVNTAKLAITTDSFALDTSKPGAATGETTLDRVINLTTSATNSLRPRRSTDPALDHATMDTVTDGAMEPVMLDLARETRGKCREFGWGCGRGCCGGVRTYWPRGDQVRKGRWGSKVSIECAGGRGNETDRQNTGDAP